jgi:hypothetical protein
METAEPHFNSADWSENSMHGLRGIADIDGTLVAIGPRICSRAQIGQELAGFPACLGTEALSPLADAAMLFHTRELAVRLATKDLTFLPEVGLRANFFDVVKSSIHDAVSAGAQGLVEHGHVDIRAISINYFFFFLV